MNDQYSIELSENIARYNDIVLRPFGINYIFKHAGGFYLPSTRCNYFEAETSISSKLLRGTPLEYSGNNKFLHYTSLQSLIAILKTRRIRLYDFNNFNDPTEFIYANKYFKKFDEPESLREYKRQLFGLSLCEFDDETVKNNINLWRLYADNGKGACITFEIDPSNIENLHDFSFSIEKEIRLFHFSKRQFYYKHESEIVKCELNKENKKVYYIEIPIDKFEDESIPFLKIQAIHLGYSLSNDSFSEAWDTISELNFPYNFKLGWTPIKEHLG